MKKVYELSLTKGYVAHWTVQDAVREIIQNAIDQEAQIPNNKMSIVYDGENALTISNQASVLNKKALLLGYTSKENDDKTIGKFGEGLKVALLVLNRLNKKVTIYNYGKKEVWTSAFKKSKKYEGEEILTVTVETEAIWKKAPNDNLSIVIEGVTKEEYSEIVKRTLLLQENPKVLNCQNGCQILLDEDKAGCIYVNGLFVSKSNDFEYGYNMTPSKITIGRDRDLVNEFFLVYETSNMWSQHMSEEYYHLIENGCKDVSKIYLYKDNTLSSLIYKQFISRYSEDAIAVSSQSEYELFKGEYETDNIIIVNELEKELNLSSEDYQLKLKSKEKENMSIETRFAIWKKHCKSEITMTALEQLEELLGEVIDMDQVKSLMNQ